jgi:hypothetical protein
MLVFLRVCGDAAIRCRTGAAGGFARPKEHDVDTTTDHSSECAVGFARGVHRFGHCHRVTFHRGLRQPGTGDRWCDWSCRFFGSRLGCATRIGCATRLGDSGDAHAWKFRRAKSYQCVRFTIPEDLNVGGFRALSPAGTHHTFSMVNETASKPDGVEKCSAATVGTRNITGSGVGTNDFMLPTGVATKLKKGQQLILNLHLFNVTDKPITGISGTLVKTSLDADVKQFAEGILAGPITLSIPPGGPSVQSGTCTLERDVTIFGVIPHMHQLGTHLKAVAHSSVMGHVVLSDRPYDFDTQIVYPLQQEVQMKVGDTIDVDCTYQNTTPNAVSFGESSLDEMCFAGVYQYPAGSDGFICVL